MDLSGSTVLVTGAASGLGAATTEMAVAAGAHVVAADIVTDQQSAMTQRFGDAITCTQTDVTDPDSVAAAVDVAAKTGKPLRAVVCCAGVILARKTLSSRGVHDLDSFNRVLAVNVAGTFNVVRLAVDVLKDVEPLEDNERGVIIMTSSVAAYDGQIGQVAYASSKGAIAAMTLPLARDLSTTGIRAVSIAPGVFETPMVAGLSDEARASLGAQVPFPSRLGRPDEYAQLAGHIIENRMINGEVIRLDGAIRMAPK